MKFRLIVILVLLLGVDNQLCAQYEKQVEITNTTKTVENYQFVFICTGKFAKVYHSSASCRGLSNCKSYVEKVADYYAIYLERRLCCICWDVNPLACDVDEETTTKFNPYVPQGGSSGGGSSVNNGDVVAAAVIAVAAVGSVIFSNDIYIHHTLINNSNESIYKDGLDFGFRKRFRKSALEYGATIFNETNFTQNYNGYQYYGYSNTNKVFGANINYVYNVHESSYPYKFRWYIGASILSLFNEKHSFGFGGITGFNYDIFSWLRFDTRAEISSFSKNISSGLIINYKK